MTLRTALAQGAELLGRANVQEPRLNAEVLLGHAVGCARSYFYSHPERELREVEWLHYGRYLHERIKGKPTQYITKKQEFYGREFLVSPDVLIPRPETELLVEAVLRLGPDAGGVVIDVGTGSGAIAVTLKAERPQWRVLGCDISAEALTRAKTNGAKHGVKVEFAAADLLSCFDAGAANIVVSNPPYVPLKDRETMQPEVRDFEPPLALFAGEDGMSVYCRLIPEARRVLRPGGLLALELGFGLSDAVVALTADWREVQIRPDLAGIPRVLTARTTRDLWLAS